MRRKITVSPLVVHHYTPSWLHTVLINNASRPRLKMNWNRSGSATVRKHLCSRPRTAWPWRNGPVSSATSWMMPITNAGRIYGRTSSLSPIKPSSSLTRRLMYLHLKAFVINKINFLFVFFLFNFLSVCFKHVFWWSVLLKACFLMIVCLLSLLICFDEIESLFLSEHIFSFTNDCMI